MSIDDDDDFEQEHADDRAGADLRDIRRFDDDTIACPHCGKQIHAEAYRCPRCKNLLTDEELPAQHGRPLWFRITAWVCVLLFTWWMIYVLGFWLLEWWKS